MDPLDCPGVLFSRSGNRRARPSKTVRSVTESRKDQQAGVEQDVSVNPLVKPVT